MVPPVLSGWRLPNLRLTEIDEKHRSELLLREYTPKRLRQFIGLHAHMHGKEPRKQTDCDRGDPCFLRGNIDLGCFNRSRSDENFWFLVFTLTITVEHRGMPTTQPEIYFHVFFLGRITQIRLRVIMLHLD